MVTYNYGDAVEWDRASYYGSHWASEPAIVNAVGKVRVQILCLDGELRWVRQENIKPLEGKAVPDDLRREMWNGFCPDFSPVEDYTGSVATCVFCRHVKTDASGQAYCELDEGDDDE